MLKVTSYSSASSPPYPPPVRPPNKHDSVRRNPCGNPKLAKSTHTQGKVILTQKHPLYGCVYSFYYLWHYSVQRRSSMTVTFLPPTRCHQSLRPPSSKLSAGEVFYREGERGESGNRIYIVLIQRDSSHAINTANERPREGQKQQRMVRCSLFSYSRLFCERRRASLFYGVINYPHSDQTTKTDIYRRRRRERGEREGGGGGGEPFSDKTGKKVSR